MGAQQVNKGHAAERISIGELMKILVRRRWTVAACAAIVLGAVMAATLLGRMQFRARGSLYLGELQELRPLAGGMPEQLDFLGSRGGDVGTEIEILRSRTLVRRAVLVSGLNVTLQAVDWSAPRYLRWRLAGRSPSLLDGGARQVLATGAELAGDAGDLTVRFGALGRYEVADGQRRVGTGVLGVPFQGGGLSVTLRAGPEGPPPVGATFAMDVTPADQVADRVVKDLAVTMPRSGGPGEAVKVVVVEYRHPSPRVSAAFVGALLRAYLEHRQGWKMEEATAAETFVSGQLRTIKGQLDDAEKRLTAYRAGSNVVALGDETRGFIDQLGKYEEQRIAARLQADAFGRIQAELDKADAPIERYLMGEKEDPVLASLSNDLAQARQQLKQVEERFTAEAPATVEQRAQVDNQLKMVKDYVEGRSVRAKKQLASLNQMIGQFEAKLKTVPAAELELAQLTRAADVLAKMYSFLLERQQLAAVTKVSTISRSRVLDAPPTPHREDSPALLLRLVLGTLMGLVLGVLVVVARWALSGKLQSEGQARHTVGELPVLATIPGARTATGTFAPSPAFTEAFRHLRTRLYGDGPETNKVVVVTSPGAGDGKTLCVMSLATALVRDGKRVLVIEADMHRPTLDEMLPIRPCGGLADLLAGQEAWLDVVTSLPVENGVKDRSVDVIAAGEIRPDSSELLSGPSFAAVLDRARLLYDVVLIDSPPFPLLSDALVLSLQAGRVLSVVRLGHTGRRAAEEHLHGLAIVSARHGVVVNDADAVTVSYWPRQAEAPRPRPLLAKPSRARAPAA
jgi:tyrosine-protein kinase Etk/Wzc